MQIRCPHCHRLGTTHPEALLGRIYVCSHCHRMLLLAPHVSAAQHWQPLTPAEADVRQGPPIEGNNDA